LLHNTPLGRLGRKEFNETDQILVCADCVDLLSENTHAIQKAVCLLTSREENSGENNTYKELINHIIMWHSSNIWELQQDVKIVFIKN
jgi:hypothetical protein